MFPAFRKLDLARLMILLVIPAALEVKGGRNGFVQGEYAFLLTLANCHCCLYGDEHTAHFNCFAPTLEEYLQ